MIINLKLSSNQQTNTQTGCQERARGASQTACSPPFLLKSVQFSASATERLEESSEAARKNDTKSMRPSYSSEQSWEHFTVSCTVFHILSLSVRIVSSRDFPKWRARSQATSHLKTDHVLAPRLRAVSYFSLQSYCKRNPRRLSFSSGPNPLL